MWMPGERRRYCLVNSLQCQRMRRWMDMRPSVESLYSIFRLHQTCCTGLYNIFISIQHISMWWMCEPYAKHVENWTQHLLKEDGCYGHYATRHRMYCILWSHKICTGFSRSVWYRVYPVNHMLKMTRGPIITTCQKIMAPAASYLVFSYVTLNNDHDTNIMATFPFLHYWNASCIKKIPCPPPKHRFNHQFASLLV